MVAGSLTSFRSVRLGRGVRARGELVCRELRGEWTYCYGRTGDCGSYWPSVCVTMSRVHSSLLARKFDVASLRNVTLVADHRRLGLATGRAEATWETIVSCNGVEG